MEVNFEANIVQRLVASGWVEGTPAKYDAFRALYTEDVVTWVQKSQPESWEKLQRTHGGDASETLLNRLEKELSAKAGSTIKTLRDGFSVPGAGKIQMIQRLPEDRNNPRTIAKYKENILRVVRQVKYNPTRQWEIDLVFFINGVPVSTVELKTGFTQSLGSAKDQYKHDRLPVDPQSKRKEPLLTFNRGAIVHFAMTEDEIEMTTRLAGENTFFLPFNKGNNGRAGNPPNENGYKTDYFIDEICQPDSFIRIFTNFVYLEKTQKVDKKGMPYTKETLIFPRYHQLEAVNKMVADVRANGCGLQYLYEHSAGSGKTNTIAWTAHELISLRNENGNAHFNTVIIVTDRNVLDAQLQDAVQQLDHQFGVIEAIDKKKSNKPKSVQLADAMKAGTPIIIVTIQTFPFALQAIIGEKSLKNKNFGVIIDEAHTSQTGDTAKGLRAALSLESQEKLQDMSVEEFLLELQSSRKMPKNISHFAFTATPKASTFNLFGRLPDTTKKASKDNLPIPFHKYSQRQAIEEGFILDVLENYTHYMTAFKLGKSAILDNKRVDKKMANRQLAKWKTLHPTIVTQKVQFIMEHFRLNVMGLLNHEAKAMVVTSGRAQAVKYKLAFDKYIEDNQLENMKALVAFSGKVKGEQLGSDGEGLDIDFEKEYSEYNLNPDLGNKDLRHLFDESYYRVMIVANKFQTGFNQPKLVAMYLDKKVTGIEAVQTLSRLNRPYPGKDKTFVIDFVNDPQAILDAFKSYDEGAVLSDVQNADVVYDCKAILDEFGIYQTRDLERFKEIRGKAILDANNESLHQKLCAAIVPAADKFNVEFKKLTAEIQNAEKAYAIAFAENDKKAQDIAEKMRSEKTVERESLNRFKTELARFGRYYNYVTQLIEMGDADLENFSAYAKLLSKRLDGVSQENIDLSGLILTGFAIQKTDGAQSGEVKTLEPLKANATQANDREKEFLDEIINRVSDLFGDVSESKAQKYFVIQVVEKVREQSVVMEQVEKNTKEQALKGDLVSAVQLAVVKLMKESNANARVVLSDPESKYKLNNIVYDVLKNEKLRDLVKATFLD